MFEGQAPITGLSLIITVNVQVEVFVASSVAVHITVVDPILKVLPEGGTQSIAGEAVQLSVADALNVATLLSH
jgi:hypothetical protein